MNQSEQISRLAQVVARMNTGPAMTAARALGWASPADRGRIAKQAGVSLGQLEEWLAGRLELPVDQTVLLLTLCHDFAAASTGIPVAALNGAASHA